MKKIESQLDRLLQAAARERQRTSETLPAAPATLWLMARRQPTLETVSAEVLFVFRAAFITSCGLLALALGFAFAVSETTSLLSTPDSLTLFSQSLSFP
jgi:hypothetical protein